MLLAVDSLHLFPKSETRKGGLDLQLSLISKNYLVMGQVARPPLRTASDSERIQALVARHSQSWSSPASGSRLRVRVTQPPRSKSSVQEGLAHKSARGRSESGPRPAVAQPIRVTDSPSRTMKRQPQCSPPRRGGAGTGAVPKGGSKMLPGGPRKFPRDLNPPPVREKEATGPQGSGKAQRVHGRTEVRSCNTEAKFAVVHLGLVLGNGSAAGYANPQGESLHCLRLFQSKQQCGGFLAPGASKLPRSLDGPPCREDAAS